jgi:chromosome segregation ATPase
MKKLLLFVFIGMSAAYFYPAKPSSNLYKMQTRIKSVGKSEADYREELSYKRAELAAYEKAITDISANIERVIANGPVCPITGEKATTTVTDDPRDDLRAKCESLREEIRELEDKF